MEAPLNLLYDEFLIIPTETELLTICCGRRALTNEYDLWILNNCPTTYYRTNKYYTVTFQNKS